MGKETIGTDNGQDFFVGQDAPAAVADPLASRTLPPAGGSFADFLASGKKALGFDQPTGVAPGTPSNTYLAENGVRYDSTTGLPVPAGTLNGYGIPAVIEQQNTAATAAKMKINSQYDQLNNQFTDLGKKEVAGAGVGVGRLRGEGFSTAANTYIDSVQKKSDERILNLEKARSAALADVDMQSASKIGDLLIKEQERQDKLAELRFSQLTNFLGLGLQYQTSQENQKINAANMANMDADNARSALSTMITQFGSSAFDNTKSEDLRALEKKIGLPAGSLNDAKKTLKEKEAEAKAANKKIEFKEVNGRIFTFDPSNGTMTNTGVTVPKQYAPGESSAHTPAQVKQQHSLVDQAFKEVKGKDGKVSASDWNKLADEFVNQGYGTYTDFYAAHKNFIGQEEGYTGAE